MRSNSPTKAARSRTSRSAATAAISGCTGRMPILAIVSVSMKEL